MVTVKQKEHIHINKLVNEKKKQPTMDWSHYCDFITIVTNNIFVVYNHHNYSNYIQIDIYTSLHKKNKWSPNHIINKIFF